MALHSLTQNLAMTEAPDRTVRGFLTSCADATINRTRGSWLAVAIVMAVPIPSTGPAASNKD